MMNKAFSSALNVILVSLVLWSCDEEKSATLPDIDVQFDIKNPSTFNGVDGKVTTTLAGGQDPMFFYWSNGDSTKDLTNVSAGTYSLKVVYGNVGVAYYEDIVVGQPAATPLTVSSTVMNATYYTANNGSIVLDKSSIAGGIPPYKLIWNDNPKDTLSFKFNLYAGQYKLTIIDQAEKKEADSANYPFQNKTDIIFTVTQPDFVCGADSIIDYNGIRYATVNVNGECWTKSNLRSSNYSDGTPIVDRFCFSVYCGDTRGAHYSYQAAINSSQAGDSSTIYQGVCPNGWHVPNVNEWDGLSQFLVVDGNGGSGTNIKQKLLGTGSSSGLDFLLAGSFGYDLNASGKEAVFWSSTTSKLNSSNGLYFMLTEAAFPSSFTKGGASKDSGLCVRCIQDK